MNTQKKIIKLQKLLLGRKCCLVKEDNNTHWGNCCKWIAETRKENIKFFRDCLICRSVIIGEEAGKE